MLLLHRRHLQSTRLYGGITVTYTYIIKTRSLPYTNPYGGKPFYLYTRYIIKNHPGTVHISTSKMAPHAF